MVRVSPSVCVSVTFNYCFLLDTGDHSAMELDVSDPKSVQNLLKAVLDEYKVPPRIVVNSAGVTRDNWLLKLSEEDYDSVMNVNLKVKYI